MNKNLKYINNHFGNFKQISKFLNTTYLICITLFISFNFVSSASVNNHLSISNNSSSYSNITDSPDDFYITKFDSKPLNSNSVNNYHYNHTITNCKNNQTNYSFIHYYSNHPTNRIHQLELNNTNYLFKLISYINFMYESEEVKEGDDDDETQSFNSYFFAQSFISLHTFKTQFYILFSKLYIKFCCLRINLV